MKYIKKYLFLLLLGIFFCFPKDTKAYQVQAYWASDGWNVQGICQDSECSSSTGAYIQHPSYHCLTILGIEFEGNYQANHNYHNDVRIVIPSSNSIAPWQNLTGQDFGWYPYGQPTNFTRETLSPASPANPQYYPTNWLDRTYNLSYDFTPSSNITKFGYYFYFNNNNCQNIGGVRVLYYNTTDLSGPVDDNESIIQNQNKNTNDIINNQNANTQEITESIDSIGSSIVDETAPSTTDIEDIFDDIPILLPGPISNLILLPLNILNRVVSETSDYCDNIYLDLPYSDEPIEFQCFKISDYLGGISSFITMVGVLFIFYQIAMLIISCWDSWTSLDSTFSSMYQPVHTLEGYKPRHAEGGKK